MPEDPPYLPEQDLTLSSALSEIPDLAHASPKGHDPYAALRYRDFRFYCTSNMLTVATQQIQTIAVGWELYERTHSAMALAWVGLIEFLPVLFLSLLAGQTADRFPRKTILLMSHALIGLSSVALMLLSAYHGPVAGFYVVLACSGLAWTFQYPAQASFMPQLVPNEVFSNAAVWNSSGFQVASVAGPAIGGLIIALCGSAAPVYGVNFALELVVMGLISLITVRFTQSKKQAMSRDNLVAGIRFVWRTKVILAAITLDMFAVLLGGVTMLLPIYAKDILAVGPVGLGWLRAAPSIGALSMALFMAHRRPLERTGDVLLAVVLGFGLTTIVFGLSKIFWLSMAMLIINGAMDNISVIIRQTLVQMKTPETMRGRVSSVNSVFLGSSNELGGFESGLVAAWMGPVFSAVAGGVGTVLVVAGIALFWPQIRKIGKLSDLHPDELSEAEHSASS